MALTDIRPDSADRATVDLDGDVYTAVITIERKLAGLCTRCDAPSLDDHQLCQPCRDNHRERQRKSLKAIRKARRRAGRCADCSKPSRLYRCPACLIKTSRHRDLGSVDKRDRIAANTAAATLASDAGRTRYHGKGSPGRMSREQLDAQDLEDAVERLRRAAAGLAYAASEEVQQLPRIQRKEARDAALALAELGVRFAFEVLRRHGKDPAELVVLSMPTTD